MYYEDFKENHPKGPTRGGMEEFPTRMDIYLTNGMKWNRPLGIVGADGRG